MGFIRGIERDQMTLMPEVLDEYISVDNPVRFLDAFVDQLDLDGLGFGHASVADVGRPPYDPGDLLKLYLYGYLNRIRSSRRLERECGRNVELMWLLRRLRPDFKTIADFRKDNEIRLAGCVGSSHYCAAGWSCSAVNWWRLTGASSKRSIIVSAISPEASWSARWAR